MRPPNSHIFGDLIVDREPSFPPKNLRKSTSTALCIFLWPIGPYFFFWALLFSSSPPLPLSFIFVIRLFKAPRGLWRAQSGHTQREMELKKGKKIDELNEFRTEKDGIMQVHIFYVLFFSPSSVPIIQCVNDRPNPAGWPDSLNHRFQSHPL